MLLTAADVLAAMPATALLFAEGTLSWGQIRAIVAEARRLGRDERTLLDGSIGASAELFAKLDPDDAVDAVRVAVAQLRDRRAVQRSEDRAERGNFLYGQPGMFSRGTLYGELDNLSLATVLGSVDALAPPDDGRNLGQRRAEGLVELARHRCPDPCADTPPEAAEDAEDAPTPDTDPDAEPAGAADAAGDNIAGAAAAAQGGSSTRHPRLDRAVPSAVVLVDLRDASVTAAGQILLNAPGCLPTLTARAVEVLAGDATVQVVLCDGARPLAVTRKVRARDIPTDIRAAVAARDRGDRFPGSRRPIGHLHHLDKRGKGHDPDFLLGTSPTSHRRIHRNDWRVDIHPHSAEVTFTRGERSWTTLPKGTRLRRPDPADGDDPAL
jgi:hypothetical protein